MSDTTHDVELDRLIEELLNEAAVHENRDLVRRIIIAGLGLGEDRAGRLDLKIASAALVEMRDAYRLFAPCETVPKVTIFGSARTLHDDPLWGAAEAVAAGLAACGWMVVTGAGPGIMEAAVTGAGVERSLGVSIRLPFEEHASDLIAQGSRHVSMKYFFTRKLMLVKESSGFVCLPGGFGTMDETFELLTLQQTGKMVPVPIVLLDRPGGTFWAGFERFVQEEVAGSGYIAENDLNRVLLTDSVDAAVAEITGFWRNYDSLRWVGERLVMRLRARPTDQELAQLNERFGHLGNASGIQRSEPLAPERRDGDLLELSRISLTPTHRAVGDLYQLIRALNELPSAKP